MRRSRMLIFALIPIALSTCKSRSAEPGRAANATVPPLARLQAQLDGIKTYRVRFTSLLHPDRLLGSAMPGVPKAIDQSIRGETLITAALPDRMRVEVKMQTPETPAMAAIPKLLVLNYDGATLWVGGGSGESGSEDGGGAASTRPGARLNQKALTEGRAPFDTGFNMSGLGLKAGQDLIGTLDDFLQRYRFEATAKKVERGGVPCELVTGFFPVEQALDRSFQEHEDVIGGFLASLQHLATLDPNAVEKVRQTMAGTLAGALRAQQQLSLCIDAQGLVRGWELGADARSAIEVTVTEFEVNPTLPATAFAVPEAELLRSQDLTPSVQDARRQVREALADTKAVASLKLAVREALKKPVLPEPAAPGDPIAAPASAASSRPADAPPAP